MAPTPFSAPSWPSQAAFWELKQTLLTGSGRDTAATILPSRRS
jgi:hypothetical protein